jgi:outer membrane lipoprotein-sorting protein
MKKSRRILRFALPVSLVGLTIGGASISNLVSADAQVPNLPALTAAQLLVKVTTAQVPAFSGTVKLTAHLGLPDLGSFGGSASSSVIGLLSGSHTATISADGATKVKVTMTGDASEQSWTRNGDDVWAWDSQTQSAQHAKMTAEVPGQAKADEAAKPGEVAKPGEAERPAEVKDTAKSDGVVGVAGLAGGDPTDSLNPADAAKQMLAMVDPSTNVAVRTSAYVASRAAYELVLSPKNASSTVSEIVIAIDGATGTPLDARITAKGASKPALEIGFTSIQFATPAASTFTFTPPAGAKVSEAASVNDLLPIAQSRHHHDDKPGANAPSTDTKTPADAKGADQGSGSGMNTVGTAWESVAVLQDNSSASQLTSLLGTAKTVAIPGGGSAKLLSTSLINVLLADDGRVAVGAVDAATLTAALKAPVPTAVAPTSAPGIASTTAKPAVTAAA